MKEKTKRILCPILVLTLCLLFAVQPLHAAENSIIDFNYYSQTLIDKYAEYGVELEMSPTENYIYTTDLLEYELSKVEENVRILNSSEPIAEAIGYAENGVSTRAIYSTKTASAYSYITNTTIPTYPLTCRVKTTASFYVDLNSDTILNAYAPTLEVVSAIGYDDWIRLNSYTVSIDNSSSTMTNHHAIYYINATVKESVSIGGATAWTKVDESFTVKLYPFK